MLMNPKEGGGYIGEDQLPHPLVLIHAFLRYQFGNVGLQDAKFTEFFRALDRDAWLRCKELNLPINDYAHTCMSMAGKVEVPGTGPIELLAFSGKGPQLPRTFDQQPHSTYILEIGCLDGRVEMCIGDLTGRIDPYIARVPREPTAPAQIWQFKNGGGGYKLFLADALAQAAGSKAPEIKQRMRVQTEASFAGLDQLAAAQQAFMGNTDMAPVTLYDLSAGGLVIPDALRPGPRHGPWIKPAAKGGGQP
jgi:hypothetical protein